jgi:hypothetical protein
MRLEQIDLSTGTIFPCGYKPVLDSAGGAIIILVVMALTSKYGVMSRSSGSGVILLLSTPIPRK